MSDTVIPLPQPKGRRRWIHWLAWSAVVSLLVVVLAYFVATSSAFLKSVILPRVGGALNAEVTVSEAVIHPFHGITLRDLKVQPNGEPPLLTADEVRVRYHLFDILRGNLHVDEIALVSPTVELVENPDGSSNLGSLMKALRARPAAEQPPAAPVGVARPLRIDLGKLTLSDATLLEIKHHADGSHDLAGLTNVNVTLTNLMNGETAKLELAADLRIENHSATNINGLLAASLKGSFNCRLNPDLRPGWVRGGMHFAVSQAADSFGDFDALSAELECEVTPTAIQRLKLQFQKASAPLGELAVTGPFDAEKLEGQLQVSLHGLDRRLLNLVGARRGLDFGTTRLDSTNEIELAKAGSTITVAGRFNAEQVRLTRAGQTTPTLDFSASYAVTVNRPGRTATLRRLNLTGAQNGAPLLSAQLTSPMSLAWGGGGGGLDAAAFDLGVTDLNLSDWQPFLGHFASGGKVGLKLTVSSQQGGRQIGFDLNTTVANLAVRMGRSQISPMAITLDAHGQAAQFKQIALSNCQLQVAAQNQPLATASGSGEYDLATGDATAQVKLSATLARVLESLPQPGVSISSGDLEANVRITQKRKERTLSGNLALADFSGQVGKNEFRGYRSQLKLDLASSPEQIQIRQAVGDFSQNGRFGGDFVLSGSYSPVEKSADVNVKLTGVNENALRPFLEPALADKQLVSVSINGVVSAHYHPPAGSAVQAEVQVANLVVHDPEKKFPATPLAVGLQVDASLNQRIADVRQLQIALTPTALATNQLQISGQVDFSKTNAVQGDLKLTAAALDLTRYYDLFIGGTNATAAAASGQSSAKAGQEPPAVHLPLRNFTVAADVGRLYLRELAISNLEATVKIDSDRVVLQPFQLALNGAPVSGAADLDLGVPGYRYEVGVDAKGVPLAPLADTFQPARAGEIGGTLTTEGQFSGAGVTGASLQHNLAGKLSLGLTNLNLSVINVRSAILKAVINVVATIPELVSNPANALTSLLGDLTGHGGLMNELQQSPIEVIAAQATAGNGLIHLQSATVQSAAFEADAVGEVTLNSVLTNSTINVPVSVSVSQTIAKQLGLTATAPSSTNIAYVALPRFLTLTGTLGKPTTDINKLALASAAIQTVGSNLLHPLGTNAPVGNLLNQFLRLGQ